ncbi:MAG: hypothetical protein ACJ74W_11590 [Pyrinomonadaceae bacterium]
MRSHSKLSVTLLFLVAFTTFYFISISFARSTHPATGAMASVSPFMMQDFPTPPQKITSALATVPADARGIPTQGNMDLYSWLTFVALNWPANTTTCGPNLNQSILSGRGPTVWEMYLDDSDVFVAPPAKPARWCAQTPSATQAARFARLPAKVRLLAARAGVRKILFRQAKASLNLRQRFPGIEEAVGGVLTDQSGRFVRYDVRLNRDEYNFLTAPQNNLWSRSGQDKYTQTITFPIGPSTYGPTGAMEIKAAWKVLTAKEVTSRRFYMTRAIVYNDDQGTPSPGPNPVTLGLVGFHILHKTRSQPTWLWSTFEHVDNLKPPPGSPFGAKASFTKPDCPPQTCPPNVQTAPSPATELDKNGKPLNKPVQVVRLNAVDDQLGASLNVTFQKLLAGSVWANYQLVSTQWVGEDGTLPKPPFMANVVLETFIQGPVPPTDGPVPFPQPGYNPFAPGVTSSCLKCHSVATTASGQAKADFSFIMGEAQ